MNQKQSKPDGSNIPPQCQPQKREFISFPGWTDSGTTDTGGSIPKPIMGIPAELQGSRPLKITTQIKDQTDSEKRAESQQGLQILKRLLES